jgi:hypothetical protein
MPGSAVERQVLLGHVPAAVARLGLRPVGRLPATNRLNLAIGLPLRNTNALNQLLQDIYDPASPQFRRYLTPEQFTEQFGPTKEDYEAVVRFAKSHGLDITARHSTACCWTSPGRLSTLKRRSRSLCAHISIPPKRGSFMRRLLNRPSNRVWRCSISVG